MRAAGAGLGACLAVALRRPRPPRARGAALWAALAIAAVILAPRPFPAEADGPTSGYSEARSPCAHRDPHRRALFGDLHVHTRLSQDAAAQGTRTSPSDAYAFARGARLDLTREGEDGPQWLSLGRPLDFAAVTDHGEQLGEVAICSDKGADGGKSPLCRTFRGWPRLAFFLMATRTSFLIHAKRWRFCGPGGERCLDAARGPWQEVQEAAEAAYDRSAQCAFTSFVAYEWTGGHRSENLHRNVIFRNAFVPALPLSTYEVWTPEELWAGLDAVCQGGVPGCDVLAIPHNPNLGGERMFSTLSEDGAPADRASLATRARMEPLLEIMQHKGESECVPSPLSSDEQCGFEKLPYHAFIGAYLPFAAQAMAAHGTARFALGEGLRLSELVGLNPFKYGFVGSSDTHRGVPGAVAERPFYGHGGAGRFKRGVGLADRAEYNPGGLAVVWAEENSRDAVFDALRRKEVYGTSGTRPELRVFGGYGLPEDLCDRDDWLEVADAQGAPMGATLGPRPAGEGPLTFLVNAVRDEGSPDAPGRGLQRVQLVKGWLEGGQAREEVFDLASVPLGGVDPGSCAPDDAGARRLCATFVDPEPRASAWYYARILEQPTCRWTAWQCLDQGVSCEGGQRAPKGMEICCAPPEDRLVQERAWSSPIWVEAR